MKRVLLVAPVPPPYGGISHWAAMVIRHSQGEGRVPLEVVDIAPRHRSEFELSFAKRVLHGVPGLFWQLIKVLKELPSKDVLALHVNTPGQFALVRDVALLFIAKLFRRRSVLHIHFGRVPALLGSTGFEPFMLRLGLRAASHVIAIDEATCRAIRESLPSVVVSRVPNCIDFSTLPEVPAQKSQTILFVGWVLPAKGIEELLGAWARISRPDWRLRIIGPCSSEYSVHLTKHCDLQGVEFAGEFDNSEVLVEMASAVLFCLPTYTEGFPNVILEAMALGCGIVTTPVGAIPEMLADGAGMMVDVGDEIALADQLRALMDDPAAVERLGSRAFERARTEYGISGVYQKYEAIWKGEELE